MSELFEFRRSWDFARGQVTADDSGRDGGEPTFRVTGGRRLAE